MRTPFPAATAGALLLAASLAVATSTASTTNPGVSAAQDRTQSTELISRATDGGLPNAPSSHAVISNDKRYARVIAFESEASDLVRGDSNGMKDIFAVLRKGGNNKGTRWIPGRTVLISSTQSGAPANGPSYAARVDGSFESRPTCVAFLSQASNIARGDTNNQPDAFVRKLGQKAPRLVSKPGGKLSGKPTTALAVSGDCKLIAYVTGGNLYVANADGSRPRRLNAAGAEGAPSFSTGRRNDLVFEASRGVYLSANASGRPRLVGRGGRNPVYNDIKRRTVAYEKQRGGHTQIAYHDIGKRERIISSNNGRLGNGNSRAPIIGNSGYYVTFDTDATNLQTNAGGQTDDNNGKPDVYLYSDTRKITLVQSVVEKAKPVPGGGLNASMAFYANYITFDSPGRIEQGEGNRQIFMRYLGGI